MAQALPLTKLAGLFVKTLAKPVSKRIKHEFSRYGPTKGFLVFLGQMNHQVTSRMTIWSAGYRVRSITPLEMDKALANGADFFGEALVFSVSGGIIVFEYQRSQESNAKKAAAKSKRIRDEQARLTAKLHALDVRLKAVENVVKSNSESILRMGSKYVEPSRAELVPIVDEQDDAEAMKRAAELTPKPQPSETNSQDGQASDDKSKNNSFLGKFWPF